MFRIYNPITKVYAKGGVDNNWSKNGKVFVTMRNLKLHLMLVKSCPYRLDTYINDDCVVINVLTNEQFPIKLILDNPEQF